MKRSSKDRMEHAEDRKQKNSGQIWNNQGMNLSRLKKIHRRSKKPCRTYKIWPVTEKAGRTSKNLVGNKNKSSWT